MAFSFIIVNYDSFQELSLIIDDLIKRVMGIEDELLIIDNNSPHKKDLATFSENENNLQKTNIYFYKLSNNLGFGKAINFAASKAKNEFLCLVNPDCRIEQDNFVEWANTNQSNSGFSVLAPRIYYPDNSPQPNLGGFATPITFVLQFLRVGTLLRKFKFFKFFVSILNKIKFLLPTYIINYLNNFNALKTGNINADWVSGAFMVVNKKDFLSINGFDDNFFMYCEDEDLCRRLRAKNKAIIWSPDFAVMHTVGATDKNKHNKLSLAQQERYFSTLYYINKWHGNLYFNLFKIFYFIAFIFMSLFNIVTGKFLMAKSQFNFAFNILTFHRSPHITSVAQIEKKKTNQHNNDGINL